MPPPLPPFLILTACLVVSPFPPRPESFDEVSAPRLLLFLLAGAEGNEYGDGMGTVELTRPRSVFPLALELSLGRIPTMLPPPPAVLLLLLAYEGEVPNPFFD